MLEVSMIRNEQNRIIHQLRKFLFKFGTPSFGIVRRILQNTADRCMVSAFVKLCQAKQEIKRTLFNRTKQDKMCKFSRKSSF